MNTRTFSRNPRKQGKRHGQKVDIVPEKSLKKCLATINMATINMTNVQLCRTVILTELYLFLPLSTERGSLLNRLSCPPDDPVGQGTELN